MLRIQGAGIQGFIEALGKVQGVWYTVFLWILNLKPLTFNHSTPYTLETFYIQLTVLESRFPKTSSI